MTAWRSTRARSSAALRAVRHAWRGPYEVALFGLAYLVYFGVRALTEGSTHTAVAHAEDVFRFEQAVNLDWETVVQQVTVDSATLRSMANSIYIYGHWPVLIVGGVLLYNLSAPHYFRLRNVCLLSGAVGLFIFALFPVAPPRLAGLGFVDTVTLHVETYRQIIPPSLVNEYAAIPSFHAGWDLMLGVALWQASRDVLVRAFAVAMPIAMAYATIATANHFVVDVLSGCAIVAAAIWVVERFEPKTEHPRISVHEARVSARPGSEPSSIRRGPSCGQRPRPPEASAGRPRAPDRGRRPPAA